jgi:hypothetical protein
MAGTTVQRRLAAILAADVVEYSRLMSIDEVRTLETLKAHRRELLDHAPQYRAARLIVSDNAPTKTRLKAQVASRLNQLRDTNLRPR